MGTIVGASRWTKVGMASLIALALACGPLDRSYRRPLVTDETPLGATRAQVKAWSLDHDWCAARTWDDSDEYVTCTPRAYEGREDDRIHSFFRFEGGALTATAVYAPVACTHAGCSLPIGVSTSLEGPPFIAFDGGLVARPTEAGRGAALAIQMPGDQRRLIEAMRTELVARHGAPDWTSPDGTAMVWDRPSERTGLFLSADALWTVETHERPAGPPGLTSGL